MHKQTAGPRPSNRIKTAMTEPSTTRISNVDQASFGQNSERQIEESIASVREALTGLRYGNVSLTVHEGRVVQIDVTEKRRLKPN